MNKTAKYISILIISAVLFSVFAFAVPFHKSYGFWTAYVAEIIAIALQYPVFQSAFTDSTSKSKFYGMPIVRVGLIYLGVQTVLSIAIFTLGFIPFFQSWISIILCAIVLGLALLGLIGSDITRKQVQQLDIQASVSADTIKNMRSVANSLPTMTTDDDLKKSLSALAEEFRFSDPVSNTATEAIEREINAMLSALQQHLSNNTATVEEIATIKFKLSQRNVTCKSMKQK